MALNDPYKTDIAYRDDFVVTATGDLDVTSGVANVRAALLRRLVTTKGSLIHRPDYGCGVGDLRNAPLTLAVQRQIATRIAEQFPRDPRVESVESVSVTASTAKPDTVRIVVVTKIVGYGEQEFTFTPFQEVVI